MADNNDSKGLLIGLLLGGAAGAIAGLLLAPKSGRELRADIKLRKDEFIDDTSEYMQIAKERASELINEGKKKSEQLIMDAKERANTLIEDANNILKDAKVKAAESFSHTKDKINAESDRIKDAFKAGVDAYNEEKAANGNKSGKTNNGSASLNP